MRSRSRARPSISSKCNRDLLSGEGGLTGVISTEEPEKLEVKENPEVSCPSIFCCNLASISQQGAELLTRGLLPREQERGTIISTRGKLTFMGVIMIIRDAVRRKKRYYLGIFPKRRTPPPPFWEPLIQKK